jgi:Protein tyrosine and serine/threonine kinase
VASLHTINLPKDVILNTHERTRSDPWILGNMVLYPAKSLGSGAYARVISGFEVSRSTGKAREVAIKVLSTFYKQEFARECNAMALLKDTPTLPKLFAAGQGNDYFYIVMVSSIPYYENLKLKSIRKSSGLRSIHSFASTGAWVSLVYHAPYSREWLRRFCSLYPRCTIDTWCTLTSNLVIFSWQKMDVWLSVMPPFVTGSQSTRTVARCPFEEQKVLWHQRFFLATRWRTLALLICIRWA